MVKQSKFSFSIASELIIQIMSFCNCKLIPCKCVPAVVYKYKSPSCSAFSFSQCLCCCSFSVPTVDTTRTAWLLEQMVKVKRPVVLVGESGTSKTATTQNFLSNLDKDLNVCVRSFALFVKLLFHSLPWC